MAKKYIYIFILLVAFFGIGYVIPAVFAQGAAAGVVIDAPLPGINCGDADNEEANQCCYIDKTNSVEEEIDKRLGGLPCLINIAGADFLCAETIFAPPIKVLAKLGPVRTLLDLQRSTSVNACVNGAPPPGVDPSNPECICTPEKTNTALLCEDYLKDNVEYDKCIACSSKGVWTGFGCIYTTSTEFIQFTILGGAVGIAGMIAFFCILYSAFIIQTSQGNAEKIQGARENLTSCIIGLLLIIFSVFILRIIGVDILQIPGFSL